MEITKDVLKRVAHLARLKLTDAEIMQYQHELSDVVNAMDALRRVETTDVPPDDVPDVAATATRPDVPVVRPRAAALVQAAPDHTDEYIRLKGGTFQT